MIRSEVRSIAFRNGAKHVAVVEVPPGPPVLSPLVAEVYAPERDVQKEVALRILEVFRESPSVTDEGIYLESPMPMITFRVDEEKARLNGFTREEVTRTLEALVGGLQAGIIQSTDTEHVPLGYRLPDIIRTLKLVNRRGEKVPLSELVRIEEGTAPETIYHKNLRRVIYVIGDVAGREEAPFYGIYPLRS